jgi:LEA14-like dessication related protein
MSIAFIGLPGWSSARWLSALAIVAALLGGCAAPLQKPEVSVAGVELLGIGLVEQRLLLKLSISNPNDVDLPIKALSFDLDLDGQPFAKGASEQPVTIARQAETQLDVKVVSRLGDVIKQLKAARQNGKLGYRIHGHVELERSSGSTSIAFDRSGEVTLSALERFVPK